MVKPANHKSKLLRPRNIIISIIVLLVVGAPAGGWYLRERYQSNLQPVNVNSQEAVFVTIPSGGTVSETAQTLKDKGLIKDTWTFEWYVRSQDARDKIQAGTYKLSQSYSIPDMLNKFMAGEVAKDLITILPAQRLDQIKQAFIKAGYSETEVDGALDPKQYKGHPALVDKPAEASLEGYLYPESFQKTTETKLTSIVEASLDEMASALSPQTRAAIAKQGLNVHQGVTLASIVEREASNGEDRKVVAQVFLKRLRQNMMLQSDPTAFYGAAIDGQEPSLSHTSPYNTYQIEGLPQGPISNVSKSSLEAVAFPAQTDYLYFVAGDDGKTYFSNTNEEHERLTAEHCKELCGRQ